MRWNDQITLIATAEPAERTNEHGFPNRSEETPTTIYANKKSVGYSEFYKAAQAGYSAEAKFDIYAAEYAGQEIAEYPVGSGKRYRVLRGYTSKNGEHIELTLVDLPEAQAALPAPQPTQEEQEQAEGGNDGGEV